MPDQDERNVAQQDETSPSDDFELPSPGRERLYGRFDGIPPQAATRRNIANRRRVIE